MRREGLGSTGGLERLPVAFPSPSFNPPGWKREMGKQPKENALRSSDVLNPAP